MRGNFINYLWIDFVLPRMKECRDQVTIMKAAFLCLIPRMIGFYIIALRIHDNVPPHTHTQTFISDHASPSLVRSAVHTVRKMPYVNSVLEVAIGTAHSQTLGSLY